MHHICCGCPLAREPVDTSTTTFDRRAQSSRQSINRVESAHAAPQCPSHSYLRGILGFSQGTKPGTMPIMSNNRREKWVITAHRIPLDRKKLKSTRGSRVETRNNRSKRFRSPAGRFRKVGKSVSPKKSLRLSHCQLCHCHVDVGFYFGRTSLITGQRDPLS